MHHVSVLNTADVFIDLNMEKLLVHQITKAKANTKAFMMCYCAVTQRLKHSQTERIVKQMFIYVADAVDDQFGVNSEELLSSSS